MRNKARRTRRVLCPLLGCHTTTVSGSGDRNPSIRRRRDGPIGAVQRHCARDTVSVQVRQAGEADIDMLVGLRASWRGEPVTTEFAATFRNWFVREGSTRWWWLAIDANEPVGMVNMKLYERMPSPGWPASRWGYLANLFVLPRHRGAGVGASLVAAVVERA